MTDVLTTAFIRQKISDYHQLVELWLDGVLSDAQIVQAGRSLLYTDEKGLDVVNAIRDLAQRNQDWEAVQKEQVEAVLLHSKIQEVAVDIATKNKHLGGDSISNIRRLYYGFITGMSLPEIDSVQRMLTMHV